MTIRGFAQGVRWLTPGRGSIRGLQFPACMPKYIPAACGPSILYADAIRYTIPAKIDFFLVLGLVRRYEEQFRAFAFQAAIKSIRHGN